MTTVDTTDDRLHLLLSLDLLSLLFVFIVTLVIFILIIRLCFVQVFVNFLLLFKSGEEDVIDLVLRDIGRPVLSQLICQIVSLVYQKDELFVITLLLNVSLQVLRIEEIRVSGIHYL